MKLKLENFNWYGIDHSKVNDHFEGDYTYIGTFCVKDEYTPRAIYFNAKPNRRKGHKDYMTLQGNGGYPTHISGISKKEMEQWRYQDGILCYKCDDLIYSVNRHDCRYCKCKSVAIDGGREYSRILFQSGENELKDEIKKTLGLGYKTVIIDLIKGEIKEE